MSLLEREFYQAFENLKRQILAQPLNLGGIMASGGGTGGPPGGFLGQLPQYRITFDESELAEWDLPLAETELPSGLSLLTNLNRIRYRLQNLEENGTASSGITIIDSDSVEYAPVTSITFPESNVNVLDLGDGAVEVTIEASGGGGLSHINMGHEAGYPEALFEVDTIITRSPLAVFNPAPGVARLQLYQEYREAGEEVVSGTPPDTINFIGATLEWDPELGWLDVIIPSGGGFENFVPTSNVFNEVPSLGTSEASLPQFDSSSQSIQQGNVPIEIAHTTGDFPNRFMLVSVGARGGVGVSTLEYNGQPLTKIGEIQPGGDVRAEMWYLLSPDVGTHDVVLTSSNNDQIKTTFVRTYYNVEQSTPIFGTFAVNSGGSDGTTLSVPSAEGTLVLDFAQWQGGVIDPFIEGSGQVSQLEYSASDGAVASQKVGEASNTSMEWDVGSGNPWATIAIALYGIEGVPVYQTNQQFVAGSLRVYWNGVRQDSDSYSEGLDLQSFEVNFTVNPLDDITVDYSYYPENIITGDALVHNNLFGLTEGDPHTQYLNEERADERYLNKENTEEFTPDNDYEPSTKKYVDDLSSRQIVFTNDGNPIEVNTGNIRIYNRMRNLTLTEVFLFVHGAPSGDDIIVDVHKNGVTIFTDQGNRPVILDGQNTGISTDLDVTDFQVGDYLTIDVDQVGSGFEGSYLTVHIVGV